MQGSILHNPNLNLKLAFEYIFQNFAYEIGFLQTIWRQSLEQKGADFYNHVIRGIISQLNKMADEGQEGVCVQYIDLIILMVDSLIFNLYSKNKSVDRARVHQQIYLSQNSQMQSRNILESMANQHIVFEVKAFVKAIEILATSQDFFDSLDNLLHCNDSDQNKLQLTHFITSLEYILEKEQVPDNVLDAYIENKSKVAQFLIERQKMIDQNEIDEVNKLLFSQKVYALKKVFFVKNDTIPVKEVHFTIGRLYFAAYSKRRSNFKRKQFKYLSFAGEDMIHNIFRLYLQTQTKRDQLFKDTDEPDPLYTFIINYLQLLYTPIYLEFQRMFDDYLMPAVKLPPPRFFPQVKNDIENYIIPFLCELPSDFLNLFAQFNQVVQDAPHFTDSLPSLFVVKNLLIQKFFLNPQIKETFIKNDYNMDNFLIVANLFKDLFYTNTNRSYSNLPQFVELSGKMKQLLETYLTTYDYDQNVDIYSYFITDPLLRNDYSYIYAYLQQVKILPSDMKDYNMEAFQSYFPKRVYIKPTDSLDPNSIKRQQEEQQKKEAEKLKTQEDEHKKDDDFADEFEKQKQGQDRKADSPKLMESMMETEKIDRATQTEVQEDDDTKHAETFKPNFNENSILNENSVTPLQAEEHQSRQQITIPSQPELTDKKQIFNFNQQSHNQQADEEVYELRNRLDDVQQKHEEYIAQLKFDHQQLLKKYELENAQLKLKNDQLSNEKLLDRMAINEKDDLIERLYSDKLQLEYNYQKVADEKQLLIDQLHELQDMITPKPKQHTLAEMFQEFDDLSYKLGERQTQLSSLQATNEIRKREYLRRLL